MGAGGTGERAPERAAPPVSRSPGVVWVLLLIAMIALAVVGALLVVRLSTPILPPASTTRSEVRPTPNVVLAIRNLSRLEAVTFHMERVVDLADHQTHLFGLIEAKDAMLLVAVGDVVAGVDLGKLREEDVTSNFEQRSVSVRLPPPEVFSTTLDNEKTRVYMRSTDTLASRHEDLEERARREAASGMEKAAREGGILDRARGGADHTVRSLLKSAGFEKVEIEWRKE